MEEKTTSLEQIAVGERFTWRGSHYVKIETACKARYGWVNCKGAPKYAGDTGHRFVYPDSKVVRDE